MSFSTITASSKRPSSSVLAEVMNMLKVALARLSEPVARRTYAEKIEVFRKHS
jgi:hypothetical protein